MNIETQLVNNFEDVLKLAIAGKVKIQEKGDLNRSIGFGVGIKLPDNYEGVLVNVLHDGIDQGICVESLSEDRTKIISKYYEFSKGEFGLQNTSKYSLNPDGSNINLRKNVWRLNRGGTISGIWGELTKK